MASDVMQEGLRKWQDINLSGMQARLDEQGLAIVENQKESQASRKMLADQTKDFKLLPDEDKMSASKVLLKAYQTEIDRLTKRSRFAETSFLDIYKSLAEAPDPVQIIQLLSQDAERSGQSDILRTENRRLRNELDQSTREFLEVKQQIAAMARLKERLQEYETKTEALIRDRVAEREAILTAEHEARVTSFKEREGMLERQLARAEELAGQLKSSHDSSQAKIYEWTQRYDQAAAAKRAELELLSRDLTRAQERIAVLNHEKEALRSQLDAIADTSKETTRISDLRAAHLQELASQEAEITKLRESLLLSNTDSQSRQQEHTREMTRLQAQLESTQSEVTAMRQKLEGMSDYEELRHELDVLRQVEFSSDLAGDENGSSTLEGLLMAKNRRLQQELSLLRSTVSEQTGLLESGREREAALQQAVTQQAGTINRLEEDMAAALGRPSQSLSALADGSASAFSNGSSESVSSALRTSDLLGARPSVAPASPDRERGPHGILPIVTGQRDRFRKRVLELEESMSRMTGQLQDAQAQLQASQSDNVKLYEKIKYLQSYRGADRSDATVVSLDSVAARYKPMYEERLNPFAEFSETERRRQMRALSPSDRATLGLFKVITTNRHTRFFFIAYTVFLHVITLAVLYGMAVREECLHNHDIVNAGSSAAGPIGNS